MSESHGDGLIGTHTSLACPLDPFPKLKVRDLKDFKMDKLSIEETVQQYER